MTVNSITDIKKCAKCDNKVNARGLCSSHYAKAKIAGEFKDNPKHTHNMKLSDRLEYLSEKITESGCQIWTGTFDNSNGYGCIMIDGKKYLAHRVSLEEFTNKKIPKGMNVCHKCDTPLCINPYHLFIGTHNDNMKDMSSKNRQNKGENVHLSKLTKEQIIAIRNDNRIQSEIAKDYPIQRQTISKIKNRKIWKHI